MMEEVKDERLIVCLIRSLQKANIAQSEALNDALHLVNLSVLEKTCHMPEPRGEWAEGEKVVVVSDDTGGQIGVCTGVGEEGE